MKQNKLNNTKYRPILGYASCVACIPLLLSAANAQEPDEDIFELSPFSVSADDNSGYRATSTLAGTRIKTDLKDLGSAISVVTAEFLEDTGTTSVEDLLVYTTSTEVGGAYGNFAGAGAAAGDVSSNNQARANNSSNTRVRGLSSAALTRDYFLSAMGFDGYNTEAVTISRGPNSILFGVGEPGGIINAGLKKAVMSKDFTTVSGRFGSHGTYRGTFDLNRVIVEDRLAIRVNAMHENISYRQKPAYEEDTRYHLAATAVLFENKNAEWLDKTILRGSWENAASNGTPPDPIPPKDHYTHWWEAPGSAEADAIVTGKKPKGGWPDDWRSNYAGAQWTVNQIYPDQNDPGFRFDGQPELWNSYAVIYGNREGGPSVGFPTGADWTGTDWSGTQVIHGTAGKYTLQDGSEAGVETPGWFPTFSTSPSGGYKWYGNGFKDHVIMDSNILDYENLLLQGKSQFSDHDLDAYNFALEQTFFNGKAGIELAVDHQSYENSNFFPFGRHHYAAVKIDTGVYLPNGALNPNLGRPMMNGMVDPINHNMKEYDTQRATAFYELDFTEQDNLFKHFGKHTFTGLFSTWEQDSRNWGEGVSWDTGHDADQNYREIVNTPGSWGGRMFGWAYVGDAQWNAANPSEMRLYTEPLDINLPKVGEYYDNFYWNKETGEINKSTVRVRSLDLNAGRSRQEIDSQAFTVQSRFLDNHLILTYGVRTDDSKTWQTQRIENPDKSHDVARSWDNFKHGDTGEFRAWADSPDPVLDATGDTTTTQAVVHIPNQWTSKLPGRPSFSAHFSESENFNPASVRRDIYNNVIAPPSGETTEYGFSVGLMEDKLHLRFNWYETSSVNFKNNNISGDLWKFTWVDGFASRWLNSKNAWLTNDQPAFEDVIYGNPNDDAYPNPADPSLIGNFTSYDEVINTFLEDVLPQETLDALNYRVTGPEGNQVIEKENIAGLSSVADLVSEGFELEATYNINQNWRMIFNASKSESTFSNGLQQLTPYTEEATAKLKSLGLWDISRGGFTETTRVSETWTDTLSSLASAASKEGTVSTELRKWRWNMITNYDFKEGSLKGLGIGGAVRWQEKASTGYPLKKNEFDVLVPVLDSPYYGNDDLSGDLWFSYKTKMFGDNIPVKFQLNFVNAFGDDDPSIVTTNPDGQVAIIRAPAEKRWFFTTTLEF